jgi:hypothetical protein
VEPPSRKVVWHEGNRLRRAAAAVLPGKSLRGLDQETRGYTNPVPEEVRS